jgi:hypothetical protein
MHTLHGTNPQQGIAWNTTTVGDAGLPLSVGRAEFTNITVRAINAAGYGRVRIGLLALDNVAAAYYCEDSARILIGKESLISVTTKWERTPPALAAGWTNFGSGNSTVEVKLANYGVEAKGLTLKGAGAAGQILTLPPYLRPPENLRLVGMKNVSGGNQIAFLGVDSGTAGVVVDDGTAPIDGTYVSLDGLGWQHW